jgi:hypothetical protein
MEYEIKVERTLSQFEVSERLGDVWISGEEKGLVLASLSVYKNRCKAFYFCPDVAEQDYPLLTEKMLDAWNGDRPSSKTDENFTLGDA